MRNIHFTKMQGAGNDYVYINCLTHTISNPVELAIEVSNRNFGIGSDGLVLIMPSHKANFRMQMYNANGTEAEMCGNASRCIAKYVYDNGLTNKKEISLETKSGIKLLTILDGDKRSRKVMVDMGEPILNPHEIPTVLNAPAINQPLNIDGQLFHITAVSMGNPHAVIVIENGLLHQLDLVLIGSKIENHSVFPNKTNVEFIEVVDRSNLNMRVWERGTGETLACGTGACASTVAAVLNELCDRKVMVHLLGGDLLVEWKEQNNHIYMTGEAVTVFEGVIY